MADSMMHLNLDDEETEKYVERQAERQKKFIDLFEEVKQTSFEEMFSGQQKEKES